MQKVMVQIDWYTKIILTLIAVLLAGLVARPYVVGGPARGRSAQEVYVTNSSLPIEGGVWVNNPSIPVKVDGWPIDSQRVELNEPIRVDADINNRVLYVVDWKEQEDYREYLRERY